jgi:TfoX/Sxy family transcriptional regulator of competence genes
MTPDKSFVEFIVDQMQEAGIISYRSMFGGYTIYCDDKIVALICNNQLFVKPTKRGSEFIGDVREAPPYPGAKLCFLVEEKVEDKEWISKLIQITAEEFPAPKPKKQKRKRERK